MSRIKSENFLRNQASSSTLILRRLFSAGKNNDIGGLVLDDQQVNGDLSRADQAITNSDNAPGSQFTGAVLKPNLGGTPFGLAMAYDAHDDVGEISNPMEAYFEQQRENQATNQLLNNKQTFWYRQHHVQQMNINQQIENRRKHEQKQDDLDFDFSSAGIMPS